MDSIAFIIESTKFEMGDLQHFSLSMRALKYLSLTSGFPLESTSHSQVLLVLKYLSLSSGLPLSNTSPSQVDFHLEWVAPTSINQPSVTATVAYAGSRMVNCTPAAFSPGYL